jgi:hypothetical protein
MDVGAPPDIERKLTYEERAAALKGVVSDEDLSRFSGADALKKAWTEGLKKALDKQSYSGVYRTESNEAVTITLLDALPNEPRDAAFFETFCRVLDVNHESDDRSVSLMTLGHLNASDEGPIFRCSTKVEGVKATIRYDRPPQGGYGTSLSLSLNIRK